MTIKEALDQLIGAEAMLLNRNFPEFNKALLMAIDALKEKEERENLQPLTNGDAIRQLDNEHLAGFLAKLMDIACMKAAEMTGIKDLIVIGANDHQRKARNLENMCEMLEQPADTHFLI